MHATIYASGSVAIPSLTDEERKRGRQALAEIRALREQLAAHGEKEPAGSAAELVRRMRDERSNYLGNR